MGVWYNGNTSLLQREAEGSIPSMPTYITGSPATPPPPVGTGGRNCSAPGYSFLCSSVGRAAAQRCVVGSNPTSGKCERSIMVQCPSL
jgi:hypothetical protein